MTGTAVSATCCAVWFFGRRRAGACRPLRRRFEPSVRNRLATGRPPALLQQERLCIAVASAASCRRALEDTLAYVKQRRAFGQPIAAFRNTQFTLAELATEVEIGQAFVDKLLVAHVRGDEIVSEVSMAKWWVTDLQKRLTSACLQLHGGYGSCSSSRSRRTTPTPPCSRSTPAPTRS